MPSTVRCELTKDNLKILLESCNKVSSLGEEYAKSDAFEEYLASLNDILEAYTNDGYFVKPENLVKLYAFLEKIPSTEPSKEAKEATDKCIKDFQDNFLKNYVEGSYTVEREDLAMLHKLLERIPVTELSKDALAKCALQEASAQSFENVYVQSDVSQPVGASSITSGINVRTSHTTHNEGAIRSQPTDATHTTPDVEARPSNTTQSVDEEALSRKHIQDLIATLKTGTNTEIDKIKVKDLWLVHQEIEKGNYDGALALKLTQIAQENIQRYLYAGMPYEEGLDKLAEVYAAKDQEKPFKNRMKDEHLQKTEEKKEEKQGSTPTQRLVTPNSGTVQSQEDNRARPNVGGNNLQAEAETPVQQTERREKNDQTVPPVSQVVAETPTTEENAETPTTEERAETPATGVNAETPATGVNAETPVQQTERREPNDQTVPPMSQVVAETPTTGENAETPTTEERAETPTTGEENQPVDITPQEPVASVVDDELEKRKKFLSDGNFKILDNKKKALTLSAADYLLISEMLSEKKRKGEKTASLEDKLRSYAQLRINDYLKGKAHEEEKLDSLVGKFGTNDQKVRFQKYRKEGRPVKSDVKAPVDVKPDADKKKEAPVVSLHTPWYKKALKVAAAVGLFVVTALGATKLTKGTFKDKASDKPLTEQKSPDYLTEATASSSSIDYQEAAKQYSKQKETMENNAAKQGAATAAATLATAAAVASEVSGTEDDTEVKKKAKEQDDVIDGAKKQEKAKENKDLLFCRIRVNSFKYNANDLRIKPDKSREVAQRMHEISGVPVDKCEYNVLLCGQFPSSEWGKIANEMLATGKVDLSKEQIMKWNEIVGSRGKEFMENLKAEGYNISGTYSSIDKYNQKTTVSSANNYSQTTVSYNAFDR